MIQRWWQGCVVVPLLVIFAALAAAEEPIWWSQDTAGQQRVRLYFFWTETCPHCQRARPDVKQLVQEAPWLELHSFNLTADVAHGRAYVAMANSVGGRAQSVPAFLFCGQMLTGYDNATGMGQTLRDGLRACKETLDRGDNPLHTVLPSDGRAQLPGFGDVDLSAWSLPAVAVTLGLLDSFNPCAFFVLLFLLSLMA